MNSSSILCTKAPNNTMRGEAENLKKHFFCWNFLFVAFSHECCFHFNANQSDVETVQSSGALDSPVFHSWFWPLVPPLWAPAGAQDLGSDKNTDCARCGFYMKCFKFLLILNVLSSNLWIKVSRVDFKWENTDMVCLGFSPFLKRGKAGWYVYAWVE